MLSTPPRLDFSALTPSEIASLLAKYQIGLTVPEVLTIQNDLLKRPPTLAECILWSIQGSEHCSYKSTREHLGKFVTHAPHVILGPKEDAGIVSVATDNEGYRYGIVVSHESHNHPSQIVPYEGAATGVGGNVRDVCCMGAEVIAVADSLRFGDINRPKTHWIHEGVVSGIAGYGNPLGIPNLAGDVFYDAAYNDNCLVTVVTLGVVREDHVIHSYAPQGADDYVFILVGKPTDNSGFGGASFASSTLKEEETEQNKGAVQEPNAFLQRHILKANYALFEKLRELNLIDKVGFKDLGAGGVACASVELAESGGYGAEINLEAVHVGMRDLMPAVILCSETQERFMWVVSKELAPMILKHYNETYALPQVSHGACASVIGKIRTDGMFVVNDRGETIVNAKASDITKGIRYNRPFVSCKKTLQEPSIAEPTDYNQTLLAMLAHENIASRSPVYEMYDKQVQGRTVIERGEAAAGVVQPFNEDKYPPEIRDVGVALALSQHPRYNKIDATIGAENAVIQAVRNIASIGATPIAITDCLCFGNPEIPEQMGEFVDGVQGIVNACAAIKVDEGSATLPVIAGNVSLYNDSKEGAIPPSPMIACVGKIEDINAAVSSHFMRPHSLIIMVGERLDECGGSVYYALHDELGANVPRPNLVTINQEITALYHAAKERLIVSMTPIADGGVATTLARMSFKNQLGVKVVIPSELRNDKILFSETGGFILEVAREHIKALQELFKTHQVNAITIGETSNDGMLRMNDVIKLDVKTASDRWENGLRERLL